MIGKLHPDEVEAVLRRQRVGRLTSVAGGLPRVVPIAYAHVGGTLYGRVLGGRAPAALRADPRVWFEVDERDGPGDGCGVVADGIYEAVTDPTERRAALGRLVEGGPGAPRGPVFRLRLGDRAGRFVRPDPAPRSGREP